MSSDALNIRIDIHNCKRLFENLKVNIKENNMEFTDHDALVLGFNLDELRLLIDSFEREINSRVTKEVMEKII